MSSTNNAGTIWVAADEEEMSEVHRKRAYYGARGVPTEVLDVEAIAGVWNPIFGLVWPAACWFLKTVSCIRLVRHAF